jgi:hypothetical protein
MEKRIDLPTIKNVDVTFSKEESLSLATENAFNKQVYSGDIYTNKGRFGGSANYWTIAENDFFASYETAGNLYFRAGKTNFADTTNGFCWGIGNGEPKFIIGNLSSSLDWNVTTASTLTITGAGLVSPVIRYGKTSFTDSTNGGYYISSAGIYAGAAADTTLFKYAVATGLIDLVGTISSRSTATIAAAINSSGNLVNDIINLRLDSSAKKILSDFNFASTDYSGGLKCGTITWNSTTGAITGGSGGVFHKGGIVFANAGVATITLDATTGNATFAGTLSAASGSLGAITIGTNAYHTDSSGNIWWGTSATYAGATYKISASGVSALSTTTALTMTSTTMRSNDGASGTRIDITDSDTAIKIRDANTDILFIAQGETFNNAVCEIRPWTNDKRALYLYTSLATATVATMTVQNDGLGNSVYVSSNNGSNTESIFKINNSTAGYALETASGKGIKITPTGVYGLYISSGYEGTSFAISEVGTSGNTPSIEISTARPCAGLSILCSHTTNTEKGLYVSYAGTGANNVGIGHFRATKANNSAACVVLDQVSNGRCHIQFIGDPSNPSPQDGDMWFTGAELYMKIGATVYKFDKTAV